MTPDQVFARWVRASLVLFAVVFVYTCELFHTPVRNSAMGENMIE